MTGHDISPVPREARPYQGEVAGLVTRALACLIDCLVVLAIMIGCYAGVVGFLFVLDPRTFQVPDASFVLSLVAGLVIAGVYLWIAWWMIGQSYGEHVMGVRVVGALRRRRLGPLRALARSVFCVLFPIGLLWCAISPRRRSVQDVVLVTMVVYDWLPRGRVQSGSATSR